MLSLLYPSFFSLLPLFFFIFFLFKWFFGSPQTRKSLPPSPPKLPIIGNFHQLGLRPHRSLQSLAQQHGPLMLLHLGSVPVLIVSSSDAAREIMKTHDQVFSNRPKSSVVDKIFYGGKDVAFTSYGEHWRQVKGICVLQLLSNKRVQSFKNIREEETTLMIEKIRQSCSSSSSEVNLCDMFVTLANDIVCRAAMGRKHSGAEGGSFEFNRWLEELVEILGVFNVGDYIPWLGWLNRINGLNAKTEKATKKSDDFLEGVINEHRNKTERAVSGDKIVEGHEAQDFVDILLKIQRDDGTGSPLHTDTIKAIVLDAFGAGTHTTSAVLEWAMSEILKHPEVMQRLQNEARQVATGKSEITEDDLDKMPYLKAVIKETLRIHVPAPLLVPREAMQDVKVMGYDIAAGTQVLINAWAIARDPSLWEEPERFWPDRFLNSPVDVKGLHFELLPFGAGRRLCPGAQFSLVINELAIAKLVHKFDFALPGGAREEDLDMAETIGITIRKKAPLLVVATPHSS